MGVDKILLYIQEAPLFSQYLRLLATRGDDDFFLFSHLWPKMAKSQFMTIMKDKVMEIIQAVTIPIHPQSFLDNGM
jgi:hypothetical protein